MASALGGDKNLAGMAVSLSHGNLVRPADLSQMQADDEATKKFEEFKQAEEMEKSVRLAPDLLRESEASPLSRSSGAPLGRSHVVDPPKGSQTPDQMRPKLSRTKSIVRSRSTSELFQDGEAPPVRTITRVSSRSKLEEDYISPDEGVSGMQSLEDSIILNIKTERQVRSRIAEASDMAAARPLGSKARWIRIDALRDYTVWMIKVIIYNQTGVGYDPPTMCLYTLPDRLELRVRTISPSPRRPHQPPS